jgi:hypothetical protein
MQTTKNCVIYVILSLLAGIYGTIFFTHNAEFSPGQIAIRTAARDNAEAIKEQAAAAEALYKGKLDTLAKTNTALGRKVANTQSALTLAKAGNRELIGLVDTLTAHAAAATDTLVKLADCDTLQTAVQELIAEGGRKDSIYDTLVGALQVQLTNRDATITTHQLEYASLQVSFEETLSQQALLSARLARYQQQVNQSRIKNKFLSAGVLVLTGVAAYGLLHH